GRWAQMLAQGQSSSAQRGGLAADVSSGLIFLNLEKKKKEVWFFFLSLHILLVQNTKLLTNQTFHK
ncbi:hypothetical protein, partial [Streptococcus oralis]|uniref:hypothetical protein n=1 Tax=Streptococcus oralis TaxID=1303 RepID=UPI002284E916